MSKQVSFDLCKPTVCLRKAPLALLSYWQRLFFEFTERGKGSVLAFAKAIAADYDVLDYLISFYKSLFWILVLPTMKIKIL